MRLIDADALDDYLKQAEEDATRMRKYVLASALNTIRGNIRKIPTIEPKTGKWIVYVSDAKVTTYKCSECGRIVIDYAGHDVSADHPYCRCGADMRGDAE